MAARSCETPGRRRPILLALASITLLAGGLLTGNVGSAGAAGDAAYIGPSRGEPLPAETRGIVPAPVSRTDHAAADFAFREDTTIVVSAGRAVAPAQRLADRLRVVTGFQLPVRFGDAGQGDVSFVLGDPQTGAPRPFQEREGYRLDVAKSRAVITAETPHGLHNGTQTLLQLLPPWALGDRVYDVAWTVPATTILDYPRFASRGLMIDPARAFLEVGEVKRIIDQMALVKANRLHIHLTDDQGWRLQIDSWPNLAAHGGTGAMAGGKSGYYTKEDFVNIVEYANDRHIEVIPEIDMPGHMTAAISSYPELSCTDEPIPLPPTRGVFPNSLCIGEESTYDFVRDVLSELAAISPSPYIHIGGDETRGTSNEDYRTFVLRVEGIVHDLDKKMIGWTPMPETGPDPSTVHHYWADRANTMSADWFANDRPVMLSPTSFAYLDYGFAPDQELGWKYTNKDTEASYAWDPAAVVDETTHENINLTFGIKESNILGVEGAIWGEEMLRGGPDVEFCVWPRLAGLMEKAWSPRQLSDSYDDYKVRLGQLGLRLHIAEVNLWSDPKVPWASSLTGVQGRLRGDGSFSGPVARLSTLTMPTNAHTAVIDWGDGTVTDGVVTGAGSAMSTAPQVATVSGTHTYAEPGTHHGSVTVTLADGNVLTRPFTLVDPTP
jgi:hexosaminidase